MSVSQQIHVTEVRLVADRFGDPTGILFAGDGVDNPSAVEFSIFENISVPYLTGNLVIQDDNNLYSRLNIQGTERVILGFRPVSGAGLDTVGATEVQKTFNVVSVDRAVKTNDYTQIVSLKLIEDVGFYNAVSTFSKSYVGKGEDIITKIVKDQLNRTVNIKAKESRNKSFRYITPYVSPFAACKTILSKLTTAGGAPYFLYSTVASDELVLNDIETIFSQEAFNANDPFVFSQGQVNTDTSNFNELVHNIESMASVSTDDTLKIVQLAGMASRYNYINVWKGEEEELTVFVPDYIDKIKSGFGRLTETRYDDRFKPGGEDDPRLLNQFAVNGHSEVFTSPYPLDETNVGFNEEAELGDYLLRVAKKGMLQHLVSNVISIQVPGFLFSSTNSDTTVGNCIEVKIFKNDVVEGSADPYDPRRSGKFCILSKRHLINITNETQTVSMELGRITDLEAIE